MVIRAKNFESITVEFNVDCKTKYGETVFICGSCEELGKWTPHNGLTLETNRRNYPEWSTTRPLVMRPNQMIEFKVCIIRESTVVWESLSENRVFFIGSKPIQIYVNFNSTFMQIHEKKIIQMEYRNGIDKVMDDMESEWGSSIGHPSNYPLERYHMLQKGQNLGNRSQISSNLMSVCDSEELELELRIMNFYHPANLNKTMSRPCEVSPKPLARRNKMISQTNKIILLHSRTSDLSPTGKIHCSLQKKVTNKKRNAIFEQKFPQKKLLLETEHKPSEKETDKTKTANTETLHSERKIMSEKDMFKRSPLSEKSSSSDQEDFENDSVEDLFGLEIF